jgi:hypothetical protein
LGACLSDIFNYRIHLGRYIKSVMNIKMLWALTFLLISVLFQMLLKPHFSHKKAFEVNIYSKMKQNQNTWVKSLLHLSGYWLIGRHVDVKNQILKLNRILTQMYNFFQVKLWHFEK